ncbi:MAG: prepilin-type N-terminal cleavage/methylation domain-containing protein [Lentisphaerae bacterium]|nr:prepilin-type N-terminal cleavage/methylation domain-containing protein [Lentisphaerota bacterium]
MKTARRARGGFSLLELMAAVAILGLIVVLSASVLYDARRLGNEGSDSEIALQDGKAALDNVIRDLRHAMADSVLSFRVEPGAPGPFDAAGGTNSELHMIVWESDAEATNRVTRAVQYRMGGTGLLRASRTVFDGDWYWPPEDGSEWYEDPFPTNGLEVAIAATNVAAFRLAAMDAAGGWQFDYDSRAHSNMLPVFVDVCIEVLDAIACREALEADDAAEAGRLVDREAVRLVGRVRLPNRAAGATR